MTAARVRESRLLFPLAAAASLLACAALGCDQPNVMTGNNGLGSGGARTGGSSGNQGGQGGDGAGPGGGTGGPGFSIPDASVSQEPDAAVNNPGNNQCAGEAHDGKILPLDLFFLVDISGSMGDLAGGKTKWVAVRDALGTFLKDGQSAGLGVGLQFFPPPAKRCTTVMDCGGGLFGGGCEQRGACAPPAMVMQTTRSCNVLNGAMCSSGGGGGGVAQPCTAVGQCAKTGLWCTGMGQPCPGGIAGDTCQPRPSICTANSVQLCSTSFYAAPAVTFADLPGNEAKLTAALMDVVPNGSTPTAPAVEGALQHLRMKAMADPTRKPVLVLATDGLPQGCAPMNNIPLAAGHLMTAFMSPGAASIPTYVIGVFAQNELNEASPALMQLAAAGGTGMPFVLTAGQDLGQRFIDALNAIRGRALGCEFMIPAPKMGAIDFKKVNVRWTGPGGMSSDLSYVASADKCDPARGGWYYDVDPATGGTPTRVRLCDSTCNQVKGTMNVKVELLFGCVTKVD